MRTSTKAMLAGILANTLVKASVAILVVAAAMIGGTVAAAAQNYPWCAQYSGRNGGAMNCGFVSFEQCMQTVQGMGGFCMANNLYRPPAGAVRRSVRRHHVPNS